MTLKETRDCSLPSNTVFGTKISSASRAAQISFRAICSLGESASVSIYYPSCFTALLEAQEFRYTPPLDLGHLPPLASALLRAYFTCAGSSSELLLRDALHLRKQSIGGIRFNSQLDVDVRCAYCVCC